MIESSKRWWQNWSKTHAYVAEKVFFPISPAEIAQAIQTAEGDRRPLRAVGGGWSFTDASLPGQVTTIRPNVYAVEALSAVSPNATSFSTDPAQPSIASIGIAPPALAVLDTPRSMVMIDGNNQIGATWIYLGAGVWQDSSGSSHGGPAEPDFLNWLGAGNLRPVRAVAPGTTLQEADTAGTLVMLDIAADPVNPNPDWFYNGHGIWSAGVSGNPFLRPPIQGTLQDLSTDNRLSLPGGRINLSPRAAHPQDSLAVLLSQQPAMPATAEPVYLVNTRSMVSTLQQGLPAVLSTSAAAATSDALPAGTRRFLFHVEAGITVSELGQLLSHQSPRLSIQAISGSPGATLAGALATGTHGAEFNWPLVTDRVKAVHLVGPGGLQWWIEGSESIADPQKLLAAYPDIAPERFISGSAPVDGILPQDWLTAAIVSLGSLGVLYSLVLEVVPLFGVREVVVQKTWGTLNLLLPNMSVLELGRLLRSPADTKNVSSRIVKFLQAGNLNTTGIPQADGQGNLINQYADLAINPNRRTDGDYDCWIGNRQLTTALPIDSQPPGSGGTGETLKGISAVFDIPGMPEKIARVYGFSVPSIAALFEPITLGTTISSSAHAVKTAFGLIGRITRATDPIDVALDALFSPMSGAQPGPEVAHAILTALLSGLLGTVNSARRSDKTGISVGALGFPESGVMGTAIEVALSPSDAFGFIQEEILDHILPQKPFLGYVSIRLCSRTATLMGMQQFGDNANPVSVMVEVVAYGNADCRTFMHDLQQRTADRIQAGTLDAMLHWGLENDLLTRQHLRAMKALQQQGVSGMSKLGTFKEVRARLHAAAAASFRAFDNQFTERLGLSSQTLAFCDANRDIILKWTPSPLLGAVGAPLVSGSRGFLRDLNLLNRSDRSVQVTEVRFAMDTPAAALFTAANPPFTIVPNQVVGLVIEYTAGAAALPLTGIVEVVCDDPIDSIARIRFSSAVVASRHAELQIAPASLDFGTALVTGSVDRVVTITNTGPFTAAVTFEVTPAQQPAAPFLFQPPAQLGPGATVALNVTYQPVSRGTSSFSLGIALESPTDVNGVTYRQRYEVSLTGRAVAPVIFIAARPIPALPPIGRPGVVRERELRLLDFETTDPNTSAAKSFWLRNRGDAPLSLQGVVTLSQSNFGVTNVTVFPAVLQPAGEMEVSCTFLAPQVPGLVLNSSFRVLSDDPLRTTAELPVRGRASGPSLTRLDAGEPTGSEALNLGTVSPSTSVNIVFRSNGTDSVKLRTLTMPVNLGFSVTGSVPTLPAVLPTGQDLTVTVQLAGAPGNYHAQLFVDYGLRTVSVELSAAIR